MWKTFCLAAGIFSCAVGVELLLVDSAVLRPLSGHGAAHTFTAPDWLPWTLLSVGGATVMHFASFSARSAQPAGRYPGH